ncbi:MAG: hypothetical protein K2W82_10680 [Candidatus Obscuribacterales bacterium]|nr:hypothetical protein [Candidatus Obscuribacterales bacterium]
MFLEIIGLLVQIAGFVFLCRYGGRLVDRVTTETALALIVVGFLGMIVAMITYPELPHHYWSQTVGLWSFAFFGGIAARMKLDFENKR